MLGAQDARSAGDDLFCLTWILLKRLRFVKSCMATKLPRWQMVKVGLVPVTERRLMVVACLGTSTCVQGRAASGGGSDNYSVKRPLSEGAAPNPGTPPQWPGIWEPLRCVTAPPRGSRGGCVLAPGRALPKLLPADYLPKMLLTILWRASQKTHDPNCCISRFPCDGRLLTMRHR